MKTFFFFVLLLLISCSDLTSTEDLDKSRLDDIFDAIENGFNENNIEVIMEKYHLNFLHNENNYNDERNIWDIRITQYDQIIIENLEFKIIENWATVNFTLKFIYNEEITIYEEPTNELGDISYFYKEFNNWFVCGKDF